MAIGSRAIKAGEAFVSMMMDDKQFSDSIEDWQQKFAQIGRKLAPLGRSLAAVGGAISTPFVLGTRNLITFTREIDLAAARLGLAGEEFGRLSAFASLTGVNLEALEIGMKTIGERIVQLQAGSNETASAFQQLGIDADVFLGAGDNWERLMMIADGMSQIQDAGLQSGLALRVLGEAGNRLLPLLRLGRDALQEAAESLDDFSPDESQLKAARDLAIEWTKLKLAATNMTGELAESLAPAMTSFLRLATSLVVAVKDWAQNNQTLAATLGIAGFALTTVGTAMLSINVAVKTITQALTAMRTATLLATGSLVRLRDALIAVEMHVSGAAIAVTGLGMGLAVVAGAIAGVGAGSIISGLKPLAFLEAILLEAGTAAWRLVDAVLALAEALPGMSDLRESLAMAKQLAEQRLLQLYFDPASPVAGTNADTASAAATAGLGNTSGIAAAFASQQTLGFTAGDPQLQALNSIDTGVNRLTGIQQELLQVVRQGRGIQ